MSSPAYLRRWLLALVLGSVWLASTGTGGIATETRDSFAEQIAALSEPGGHFDTDNLISNERSYLQVLPDLERAGVRGGAYVGVGPDQNFSYIADIRPAIAFIVDIRRDNLLLHLLFKALFEQARSRVDYLALLFGRRIPDEATWRGSTVDRLAAYVDDTPVDRQGIAALRARTDAAIGRFEVPLTAEDLSTIDRFHRTFIEAGLGLRFESTGRPPQSSYPTYRDLLLATDALGRQKNFLASEDSFQFVKSLQRRDLVVPVVGDLSGPKALAAIGRLLTARGEQLSAFYTSNVEFYLYRAGTSERFLANLTRLPHSSRAVIIRSVFGRFNGGSASVTEPVEDVLGTRR